MLNTTVFDHRRTLFRFGQRGDDAGQFQTQTGLRSICDGLDRDRLGELHELYLSCGVRRREDTVYMRSIQPDFEVNTSRW